MQIQDLKLFPKQSVYSSSPLLFFYGLYKQKSILEKPLGTKQFKSRYSLQILCTINQKDNSPSLTHIILSFQTSFMSSPARQGNHSVSQAYSKGRSTNKINTKCERLQSKLIFNFLGIFSWYPLGRIRSKLYIAIILKNKEIIILQILQSIWKGPCSKCDIHYS